MLEGWEGYWGLGVQEKEWNTGELRAGLGVRMSGKCGIRWEWGCRRCTPEGLGVQEKMGFMGMWGGSGFRVGNGMPGGYGVLWGCRSELERYRGALGAWGNPAMWGCGRR